MFGLCARELGSRLKDGEGRLARTLCSLWERPLLDGRTRLGKLNGVPELSDAIRPADLSS